MRLSIAAQRYEARKVRRLRFETVVQEHGYTVAGFIRYAWREATNGGNATTAAT